ncbi:DUF4181 domain-containing protein [Oceanobacillus rekensis]|uniref:DUF4181 domain-containing protein n=1 Tax=Oceanobacillus rekensis TaxID=937927 RepID=UPI0015948D9A|nr:DUF4181 domain-containing protein [Oceanobacillus rekensis]
MYDGSDSSLILDIVFIIVVLSLIIFIFNCSIRKLLNVERPKWFSNQYVNDKHKKYDIGIRVISVIVYMMAVFYFIFNSPNLGMETTLYLFVIGMVFLAIQEIIRFYMEWKYLKGKNNYLFTLFQLIFIIALVIVLIRSGFFGIFHF